MVVSLAASTVLDFFADVTQRSLVWWEKFQMKKMNLELENLFCMRKRVSHSELCT